MPLEPTVAKVKAVLTIVLLGALVYAAATHLDIRLMARLFAELSPLEVMAIALLPMGMVTARAARFVVLSWPATRRERLAAFYGYCASQAVSAFPTGVAGRAAVVSNSGLPFAQYLVLLMTDSFFDLSYLALSTLLVAFVIPAYRTPIYLVVPLLIALVPLVAASPLRHGTKRLSFAAARRLSKVDTWKNLCRAFRRLRQSRSLVVCAALTLIANGVNLFALWCSVRAFDLQVPISTLLLSLTLPTLMGRIVFLPGSGTGVVAAGMAAVLAHSGAVNANQGAAISIVYRLIDMAMPTVYGWCLLLFVRSPGRTAGEETDDSSKSLSSRRQVASSS